MNINLVLANNIDLDPTVDLGQLKNIGSLWGSWRTWRACSTDNVICHSGAKAADLINKGFNRTCNFYIPNSVYVALDTPDQVLAYGGTFEHEVREQDELVAMHLAAGNSDIILLLGFDWSAKSKSTDPDQLLLDHNYQNLVLAVLNGNPKVQWVLCDHPGELAPEFANLDNLTQDTLVNVFKTLAH